MEDEDEYHDVCAVEDADIGSDVSDLEELEVRLYSQLHYQTSEPLEESCLQTELQSRSVTQDFISLHHDVHITNPSTYIEAKVDALQTNDCVDSRKHSGAVTNSRNTSTTTSDVEIIISSDIEAGNRKCSPPLIELTSSPDAPPLIELIDSSDKSCDSPVIFETSVDVTVTDKTAKNHNSSKKKKQQKIETDVITKSGKSDIDKTIQNEDKSVTKEATTSLDKNVDKQLKKTDELKKNGKGLKKKRLLSDSTDDSDSELDEDYVNSVISNSANNEEFVSLLGDSKATGNVSEDSIVLHVDGTDLTESKSYAASGSGIKDENSPAIPMDVDIEDEACTLQHILDSLPACDWSNTRHDKSTVKMRGRYYQPLNVRCNNCNERGHLSKICPKPKKVMACLLCGQRGHGWIKCPDSLCYNCYVAGHTGKECSEPRRRLWEICHTCEMQGHKAYECPNKWRQFHITTDVKQMKEGKIKENSQIYCSNCGRQGHFHHDCQKEMFDKRNRPTWPFVARYRMRQELRDLKQSQKDTSTNSGFPELEKSFGKADFQQKSEERYWKSPQRSNKSSGKYNNYDDDYNRKNEKNYNRKKTDNYNRKDEDNFNKSAAAKDKYSEKKGIKRKNNSPSPSDNKKSNKRLKTNNKGDYLSAKYNENSHPSRFAFIENALEADDEEKKRKSNQSKKNKKTTTGNYNENVKTKSPAVDLTTDHSSIDYKAITGGGALKFTIDRTFNKEVNFPRNNQHFGLAVVGGGGSNKHDKQNKNSDSRTNNKNVNFQRNNRKQKSDAMSNANPGQSQSFRNKSDGRTNNKNVDFPRNQRNLKSDGRTNNKNVDFPRNHRNLKSDARTNANPGQSSGGRNVGGGHNVGGSHNVTGGHNLGGGFSFRTDREKKQVRQAKRTERRKKNRKRKLLDQLRITVPNT